MSVPVFGSPFYFSPIDVDERIGRALVRTIWLKYGMLGAGIYATVGDLRAADSRAMPTRGEIATELAYVQAVGHSWGWDCYSLRADDGVTILRPTDRAFDVPGRWVSAPFRDFRGPYYWHGLTCVGFVDRRIPLDAPSGQPSLLTLCKGHEPAVFVCFAGKAKPEVWDQEPGAGDFKTLRFDIKVISKNWRGSPAARFGSGIAEEAAKDPGTSEIIGRIEWLLRGSQGLYGTVPGGGYQGAASSQTSPWTDFCRISIEDHQTGESFGPDMRLMDTLSITIKLATERPNESEDLVAHERFLMQETQPQPDGSAIPIGEPYILISRPPNV